MLHGVFSRCSGFFDIVWVSFWCLAVAFGQAAHAFDAGNLALSPILSYISALVIEELKV